MNSAQKIVLLGTSYTAAAKTLFAAMTTPPTGARKRVINNFIVALQNNGIWTKLDVLWIFAAHSSQAALLNWKNPAAFTMVANNSPAFTVDQGYLGNSTSTSLVPTWNPTTFGGNFTLNDAMFGGWLQQASTVNSSIDFYMVATGRLGNNTTSLIYQGRLNDGTSFSGPAPAAGHWAIRRSGATARTGWFNGSIFTTDAVAATSLPTNMALLSTGAASFGNSRISAAYAGGGFTDADMVALNSALTTLMAAVGVV